MVSQWPPAPSRAQREKNVIPQGKVQSFSLPPGVLQLQFRLWNQVRLLLVRVMVAPVISKRNAWYGKTHGSVVDGRGTVGHYNNSRSTGGEMLPWLHLLECPVHVLCCWLSSAIEGTQLSEECVHSLHGKWRWTSGGLQFHSSPSSLPLTPLCWMTH